jgi:hypothetical protein
MVKLGRETFFSLAANLLADKGQGDCLLRIVLFEQSCSQGAGDQPMIVSEQTEWTVIKEATILQAEV